MQFLKLLVELSGFFEFAFKVTAAELESPIYSDGKRTESHDAKRVEKVCPRQPVALDATAKHEMAIETHHERNKQRVYHLKPKIPAYDILNATLVSMRHSE